MNSANPGAQRIDNPPRETCSVMYPGVLPPVPWYLWAGQEINPYLGTCHWFAVHKGKGAGTSFVFHAGVAEFLRALKASFFHRYL